MKFGRSTVWLLAALGVLLISIVAARQLVDSVRPALPTATLTIARGSIRSSVSATGTIEPQNRIVIRSPANGRAEKILVREGDRVRRGQVLVWMSSAERAALLDAARIRGDPDLAYWEGVYKPSPIIAATDGQVIVRSIEPGQTIAVGTALIALSDRLIMKARVDETDIGRVRTGQVAVVTLDAFPNASTTGTVDHIAYESVAVNNVTVYETHVAMDPVPEHFRSGMNAQLDILSGLLTNVTLVPLAALQADEKGFYVVVPDRNGAATRRHVTVGVRDRENAQVLAGITSGERVALPVEDSPALQPTAYASALVPFGKRRPR